MRIGFWLLQDSLQDWKQWVAGIYYVRNCLAALAKLPEDMRPAAKIFLPESCDEPSLGILLEQCREWAETIRIPPELARDRDQLQALADAHPCEVYFPLLNHPPIQLPGRWIGWIADLQHCSYPEFFSPAERQHRDALFRFLLATCNRIVCSSQAVEKDLQRNYQTTPDKTSVIRFVSPVAAAPSAEAIAATLATLNIDRPFIYLPNQFWLHKNHHTAFEAWRKLQSEEEQPPLLVCSGALTEPRDDYHIPLLLDFLETHQLEKSVRVLGLIPRDQQAVLYHQALAVLQPSLFEGWSTTVEEAKSIEQRLILSDIPVHREQADGYGEFFAARDADSLAAKVRQVQTGLAARPAASLQPTPAEAMLSFGRDLLTLFEKVAAEPLSVAQNALPLLLRYEDICRERLELIERLAADLQRQQELAAA